MKECTVSWYEYTRIPVRCWWRRLLGLPRRTEKVWIRRSLQLGIDANTGELLAAVPSFDMRGLQIEQGEGPTPYCNGTLGAGYNWINTPHRNEPSIRTTTIAKEEENE